MSDRQAWNAAAFAEKAAPELLVPTIKVET